MTSLSTILTNVLSAKSDYCCLCFESIAEQNTSYNMGDEVSWSSKQPEEIYEIISTVLGDKVLDSITTHIICQHCTKMALNCYKFIQQCRTNIHQLENSIQALQECTADNKDNDYFKSLFLALDSNNYNIDPYYDMKQNNSDNADVLARFQLILQKSTEIQIIIENEEYSKNDDKKLPVNRKKHTNKLHSIELSDIVCDNNELNNYKCKTCLKLYSTAIKLKQHYLRVHAPKKFKCSECQRSFGTSLLLKRHTQDSHCTAVCSQCGKTYTNTFSLRHHERSHKLRLVCQTCGKTYKGKKSFNNHIKLQLCKKMRKSNAEAKFTCDYCKKKYAHKTSLSVHIRLQHENGKALICDWCGKRLSSISRLKDHLLKHTKEKKFECEICKGKFVTKASLLYHTRRHTGEKPYKCEHCDLAFLSASRRSEHVKRNHENHIVECDICHRKYKHNTILMRHRKRHFNATSRFYHKPSVFNNEANINEKDVD